VSTDHEHLERAGIVERLRLTPLFGGLPDDQLNRLVDTGEIVDLAAGDALIVEGDIADALYVVLEGELDVTKRADRAEIPLARVGPGSLQGEIAALEGGRRLATVRAATPAEVLRIPVGAVRALLAAGPDVALAVIRTAVSRLRQMESTLREREKLAALGTLSAGLAHELNNPAAAALRATEALGRAVAAAESNPRPVPPPQPPAAGRPLTALERADRLDELANLVPGADEAAALADAGWTADALAAHEPAVRTWLAANAAVHQLLGELEMAVGRMSEIVGAVKGYAYLDQAPMQRVDVRVGLEQTLIILRHRLREGGVTVERELDEDIPEVDVRGSELNQVWTNLVDNAIDAMDGRGTLLVRTEPDPDGDGVRVTIGDSGPGIPEEIRARLFEPFATTKPPGKGTGLGLHIVHTVVTGHGGRIDVEREGDRTLFVVSLPRSLPEDRRGR
jgi:signal transduction histidine kinase